MKKIFKSITRFIKLECANYESYYNCCSANDLSCKVLCEHGRCGYLEKSVLGPAGYKYKLPGYDYAKLFGEYAESTLTKALKVQQRRCDCGEPLQHRQRFCESCRRIQSRSANRERQRKHRFSNSPNVTL